MPALKPNALRIRLPYSKCTTRIEQIGIRVKPLTHSKSSHLENILRMLMCDVGSNNILGNFNKI